MKKNKNKNWGSNGKKGKAGDEAKKILSGVLFMAACFLSVYVLVAHNELVWLVAIMFVALMAAAYFFLGQIFNHTEEQIDDLVRAQEALEAVKEEDRKAADAAFKRQVEEQMKSMDRTTRAMFMTMKKSAEAQAVQLSNMEKRIDKSIDEQNAGIKTIIKYNKENARQMAKSEKDALEKMATSLTDELKMQGRNQAQPAVQYVQMPMAQPVYQQPVMQEPVVQEPTVQEPIVQESTVQESVMQEPVMEREARFSEDQIADMLSGAAEEIPVGLDFAEDISEESFEAPEINIPEEVVEEPEIAIPEEVMEEPELEIPEEIVEEPELEIPEEVVEEPELEIPEEVAEESGDAGGLLSEDEIAAMLAGAVADDENEESAEEEPVALTSEADLAAATGVDLSDPNAALSADDIAKLFAAAGNNDAPAQEAVEEAPPTSEADLAAATGVDLSDPNAALSADDIAKLFAAAGNQ